MRWKRLDPRGPVPLWFDLSVHFLGGAVPPSICPSLVEDCANSDVRRSHDFGVVCNALLTVDAVHLSVYMDRSLSGLGTVDVKVDAAIFFEDIDSGLGVGVFGLVFSTLTELQAIALALEFVLSFCLAVLDVYKLESLLVHPDFRNRCWIECHHIANVICHKNLGVNWIKIRSHSGISGNERADALAKKTAFSTWRMPHLVGERFLKAGSAAVSGNPRRFVYDVFCLVHHARWEVGSGSQVVTDGLHADINWFKSFLVWHPNSHLAAGSTSMRTAGYQTYFIKALYCRLLVAVRKRLYDRRYPSVMCFYCADVEFLDHVFYCSHDKDLFGLSQSSSDVSQLLATCGSKFEVGVTLFKGFVFNNWYHESVSVFKNPKVGARKIVDFVRGLCLAFRDDIWLCGLIPRNGSTPAFVSGLPMVFLAGVVRLLGVAKAFGVGFGFHKFCPFFLDIKDLVSVHIGI
ncbi:hypothetical protein G9A89_003950 [Geosiphon pyriformis]|nr:hypothetical protein G9A89_003950 [Geosiphon pyriformis]